MQPAAKQAVLACRLSRWTTRLGATAILRRIGGTGDSRTDTHLCPARPIATGAWFCTYAVLVALASDKVLPEKPDV